MNMYNLLISSTSKSKLITALVLGLGMLSVAPCAAQQKSAADTIAPAGNPFVRYIYTADPSAHVWKDGRLYVYPSHDVAPPRGCDLMDQYHVYSTADMVTWKDEGEILRASQVEWARPEGGVL